MKKKGEICLLQNIKVNDYDGRTLTSNYETTIDYNLTSLLTFTYFVDKIKMLKKWYTNNNNKDYTEVPNMSNSDKL